MARIPAISKFRSIGFRSLLAGELFDPKMAKIGLQYSFKQKSSDFQSLQIGYKTEAESNLTKFSKIAIFFKKNCNQILWLIFVSQDENQLKYDDSISIPARGLINKSK